MAPPATKRLPDIWAKRKQEAMTLLQGAMTKLPVRFWEKNMLFTGVENTWWRQKTDTFPATNFTKGTHPLFVLRAQGSLGFQVCPCSSSGGCHRYITKGCTLLQTKKQTDQASFLVEYFRFSLPLSITFTPQPIFKGQVPLSCLKEARS